MLIAHRAASVGLDPLCIAYHRTVMSLGGGGRVNMKRLQAADRLFKRLRSEGLLGLFTELSLPCVANDVVGTTVPFIRSLGAATWTPNNVVSADVVPGLGVKGNGSNKWYDTGINPQLIAQNNNALMVHMTDVGTSIGTVCGMNRHRITFASGNIGGRNMRNATMSVGAASGPTRVWALRDNPDDARMVVNGTVTNFTPYMSEDPLSDGMSVLRSQLTGSTYTDARVAVVGICGARCPSTDERARLDFHLDAFMEAVQ
jgi:hypothetical protein